MHTPQNKGEPTMVSATPRNIHYLALITSGSVDFFKKTLIIHPYHLLKWLVAFK